MQFFVAEHWVGIIDILGWKNMSALGLLSIYDVYVFLLDGNDNVVHKVSPSPQLHA